MKGNIFSSLDGQGKLFLSKHSTIGVVVVFLFLLFFFAKLAEMAKRNPIGVSNRVEENQSHHYIFTTMNSSEGEVKHFSHCLKITQNVAFAFLHFWHFPSTFVLFFKATCLVSLFDCKLQVFKNSSYLFCPLKILNETFPLIFKPRFLTIQSKSVDHNELPKMSLFNAKSHNFGFQTLCNVDCFYFPLLICLP